MSKINVIYSKGEKEQAKNRKRSTKSSETFKNLLGYNKFGEKRRY